MNPEAHTSADQFRRRSGILFLILIAWGVLAAAHILYYSWYRRDSLLKETLHLAWREGVLPPLRGRILSADSRLLAWTELTHDLILRKPLPPPARFEELIRRLTTLLPDLDPEEKEAFILLKRNISPDAVLKIEALLSDSPELSVVPRMIRRSVDDPGLREVLGETMPEPGSPALRGVSGLEQKYDSVLAGKPGKFRVMLGPGGKWISGTIELIDPPENGKDVVLPETFQLPAGKKRVLP